jgi:hypothetical protein
MSDDAKRPGIIGAITVITAASFKWVSDAFKGPLLASILIIAALAFVSALADRLWAVISRRRKARALLRMPPETTAKSADPYALGIFPARSGLRRNKRGLPIYVERGLDKRLRSALRVQSAVVVIGGPPLSGKSRTAYEAIRSAFPDAGLLYPRNADALRKLAGSDLRRQKRGSVILWLDDLSRFDSALDAQTWQKLVRAWPGIRVLATIRTVDFAALCGSGGAHAEAGRFLLSRASRFQLELGWTDEELERAAKLHPGIDLSRPEPVAHAFAVDWNEWSGSGDNYRASRAGRSTTTGDWFARCRQTLRPDLQAAILTGLLAGVTGLGLFLWLITGSFDPPPSLPDQLSRVTTSPLFANDDVQHWPVRFQGDGRQFYIFYSHSKTFDRGLSRRQFAPTDTLRIYSASGAHLSPTWTFAPTYVSGNPLLTGDGEFFEKRSLTDLVGSGEPQLVGVYFPANQSGAPALPVIVYWDDAGKRYVVDALMEQPTLLAPVAHLSPAARAYRAAYDGWSVLDTHARGQRYVVGHPVQDIAIVDGRNGSRIVMGYVAQTLGSPPRISLLEVQAWSIGQDPVTGNPTLQTRCVLRGDTKRRFFVTPIPGLSYPTLLKEYWEQFDSQALC